MPGMVQPERELEWDAEGRLVKARVRSVLDGKWYEMDTDPTLPGFASQAITRAQWDAWQGGQNITSAMPQLGAGEREFLMSGITPEAWEREFAEEDH